MPERAVAAWQRLLGTGRVLVSPAQVESYAATTLARAPAPAGVLQASSREEVVDVVRIASEHGAPLYPISRGKNWGYGDAAPVAEGQFVLDLSEMNRIVEVDPDLAYAVVEPGVSQRQLQDHLKQNGHDLWMSCTGSSPDASVVGNLVERGYGVTPYSDHAGHACGLEVVMADGTLLQTGLDRFPNADGHVYRWGLGPHLDGLFTQSNLGIVVRAGIWLMRPAEAVTAFTLTIDGEAGLEQAVDRIRELRLSGVVTSPVYIENVFRALANRRQYPWEQTGGATPLAHDVAARVLREDGGPDGRWIAAGALYATRRQMRAAVSETKSALRPLGELRLISPKRLEQAGRLVRPLAARSERARKFADLVDRAQPLMRMLQGEPSYEGLGVARWRVRAKLQGECEDPTGEGCGLYWLAPVCPAKGTAVRHLAQMIEQQMLERGFEPLIRIAFANDRSVFVTTLVAFDRGEAEEADRAAACHRELSEHLIEAGFPPYRLGVTGMDLLDPKGAGYSNVVGGLKRALDPQGILAPGRYEPQSR